jgi:hypothetical protein
MFFFQIVMGLFTVSGSKIFDKLLGKRNTSSNTYQSFIFIDKATSPLLLEPDWDSIIQLCDVVKSQEVTYVSCPSSSNSNDINEPVSFSSRAKYVVQSIKKRFGNENAHVVLSALLVCLSVDDDSIITVLLVFGISSEKLWRCHSCRGGTTGHDRSIP